MLREPEIAIYWKSNMFSVKPSDSDLIGALWLFKIIYKQMGYVCQTSPFGFSKNQSAIELLKWNLRFTTLILICEKYRWFFCTYIYIHKYNSSIKHVVIRIFFLPKDPIRNFFKFFYYDIVKQNFKKKQ